MLDVHVRVENVEIVEGEFTSDHPGAPLSLERFSQREPLCSVCLDRDRLPGAHAHGPFRVRPVLVTGVVDQYVAAVVIAQLEQLRGDLLALPMPLAAVMVYHYLHYALSFRTPGLKPALTVNASTVTPYDHSESTVAPDSSTDERSAR